MSSTFQSSDPSLFTDEISIQKKEITRLYMQLQNFGHSRNKDFDDFLDLFSQCIGQADDIHLWIEKDNLPVQAIKYQIERLIGRIKSQIAVISEGMIKWHDELSVTQQDYDDFDLCKRDKPTFKYTQTLPISKEALNVQLDVIPTVLPDKTVQVSGKTNLFDGATLLLSLCTSNGVSCSGKVTIKNGQFSFPTCSDHGNGFASGIVTGTITLSLPSTQPKEFIKFAGIEYEKLTGDFIKRDGIGPIGRREFSFAIE